MKNIASKLVTSFLGGNGALAGIFFNPFWQVSFRVVGHIIFTKQAIVYRSIFENFKIEFTDFPVPESDKGRCNDDKCRVEDGKPQHLALNGLSKTQ